MTDTIVPAVPAVEPVPAVPAVPDTPAVDTPAVEPVTPVTPAPTEPTTNPTEPTTADWTALTEDIKISGVKYNEVDVDVVVPVEVANLAGEKGIDIEAVSKELYSSEDFTLKEETLNMLYDAFGEWQVQAYLSGIKAKNDSMITTHKSDIETKTANETKAWESTMEIMGGEDRWNDMSAYADKNLDDAARSEFNAVMENGSLYMQQLMIKDLYNRFTADGAPTAPTILNLEEGSNSGTPDSSNAALSATEYLKLISSGEYNKDPEKYDKLRRLGLSKGI